MPPPTGPPVHPDDHSLQWSFGGYSQMGPYYPKDPGGGFDPGDPNIFFPTGWPKPPISEFKCHPDLKDYKIIKDPGFFPKWQCLIEATTTSHGMSNVLSATY